MNMFTKILIVGPAWIGDMVMAQTLFKLLKQRQPNAIIHVLAPKWTSPLLERMLEVDHILISPFEHKKLNLYKRYVFAKELRKENYHQAIILPNSFKSALIPYWAQIPRRTGWRGEMRYGLINDMRILDKAKLPLMIQRFAALGLNQHESLLGQLPWPTLQAQPSSRKVKQSVLAICPGAEYGPTKQWPADYFAEVAKNKLALGWQVWIFGGKKDQIIANEIQQLTDNACIDFTGKTSLQQVIDLMSLVSAVVSNDTGLMHIAASLQRPLVVIYGSSSPQFTPPLAENAQIVSLNLSCSPCFKRFCPLKHVNCLMNLTPEIVLAALNRI
ncbi:MAG: ADP-heptose--LPS heptosyltransferase [Coxiella sp. DG_40]|nr:MAG: ADP-heptose--LPS heptosyltransferase [Coxiella sp. DG_40]